MPPYLLINPLSGSYSPALRKKLLSQLNDVGIYPEIMTVTGPEDARRICAQIEDTVENPFVIVAGGDGTINVVINALEPGRSTLAVLPVGTANVLARELGIDGLADGVQRIAKGISRPFSVGVIENSSGVRQRFVLMAGIGLDGSIVQGVRLWEKRLLKKGAYLLSALRCLLKWRRGSFSLQVAGRVLRCHSVIICNAARYGGDFVLAPEASIFEPELELFCVISEKRRAYLKIILSFLAGRSCRGKDVTLLRAKQFEIVGDSPVQVDGDHCGLAPVRISTISDFAKIIV